MDDLVHGGALGAMAGAFPDAPLPWIDLSTGINPWPYPIGTLSQKSWHNLPDRDATDACVRTLANVAGCAPANVALTPGSTAAMVALKHALNIADVAVIAPTYGGYGEIFPTVNVVVDLEAAIACKATAIVLGNPNNPDGIWQDIQKFEAVSAQLAAQGRWLIVDEAFGDVAPHKCASSLAGMPGLLILRSFGKFYGLAGLRLGAVLGPAPTIEAIKTQLGPWPVSGPALEVGARAYADTAWQKQMAICLNVEAAALDKVLMEAGFERVGGTPLFRLVSVPDAHAIWIKLAKAGIYVRRFAWSNTLLRFGLPADSAALARLASALQT